MPLYHSPHALFQVILRPERKRFHPVTGDVIEVIPALWAHFGRAGDEYEFRNPMTGEMDTAADIQGHYYDSDAEADQHGWDPETHEMVVRKLDQLCRDQPDRIRRIEVVKPPAGKPWPSYDDQDADTIAVIAEASGLWDQVRAYEAENRQRPVLLDPALAADAVTSVAGIPAASPQTDPEPKVVEEKEPVSGATITV